MAALQNLVKIMSLYYQYMETYMGPALFAVSSERVRVSFMAGTGLDDGQNQQPGRAVSCRSVRSGPSLGRSDVAGGTDRADLFFLWHCPASLDQNQP